MKNMILVSVLMFGALSGSRALAFAPEIQLGAGMFIAKQTCTDLGIAANDGVEVIGDYTHLLLSKDSNSTPDGQQVLLQFSVPDDGSYVFEGFAGQQYTNEFLSNGFSGASDIYDFKADDQTGNLTITHTTATLKVTHCLLTNNTGG